MSEFAFKNLPSYRNRVLKQYSKEIKKTGKKNPYERFISFGRIPQKSDAADKGKQYRIENPFYQSPESISKAAAKNLAEQSRRFRQSQSRIFRQQQSDIAKQLRIIQEDKSAVSKLMDEYRKMLMDEADAKRKAQEEQQQALQTARANTARSSMASGLQIQLGGGVQPFSSGFSRRTSGSGQFKGRLNIGQSNMVNI